MIYLIVNRQDEISAEILSWLQGNIAFLFFFPSNSDMKL